MDLFPEEKRIVTKLETDNKKNDSGNRGGWKGYGFSCPDMVPLVR